MNTAVPFRRLFGLTAAAAAAALLVSCSSGDTVVQTDQAGAIIVEDAWVKATDTDMTAAFAHLTNETDTDVRVVSATSDAADRVELHEVVTEAGGASLMQVKEDGLVIPADGDLELKPGSDHIMLMDLTTALQPGTDVEIVVTFEDGSSMPIVAQVRDFPGADENYAPEHGDHDHDHGDHDHGDHG